MIFEKKKILVTVKTYPNPSTKHQETVCVAGVLLEDPLSWIRIYPVPFRDLPKDQQFSKYQIIEAEVARNLSDPRPESYKIIADSIKTLETIKPEKEWRKRKEYLLPLRESSMCEIQRKNKESGLSLGIFKPAQVKEFLVEPSDRDWSTSDKNILSQIDFLKRDKKILEKIPFKFKIKYRCEAPDCKEHVQGIIDWETSQLYRNLRDKNTEDQLIQKMKEKYLDELCSPEKDTFFITGNQRGHPASFLILSVFWPPKE